MPKRYYIHTVRSGSSNGGMTCGGWYPGPIVVEAYVKPEDGEQFFLSMSLSNDAVCVYKTPDSSFDKQIEEIDDDEFWNDIENKMTIFGENNEEVLLNSFGNQLQPLYKYLEIVGKKPYDGKIVEVDRYVDEILEEYYSKRSD